MYLHQFANPVIHDYDTLTNPSRWGDKFDVILANPPFMSPKGGVRPHDKFRIAANRTEVLFADFMLEHLTPNGRAGFIVPEGIIFQNNDDYVSLRKWLINEAGLWAVVSLPANVFQPYSGVKTSVLLVDRALARQRDAVLLVKLENDGFSLNTNRTPINENDLPDALKLLHAAKLPDFQSAIRDLQSAIQHRLVPRADFAKLDAYKASTAGWDFCRRFFVRAERLKKAADEARAIGDENEETKAEKALVKVRGEFSAATGLGKLPATEPQLRARFAGQLKEAAVAYGDLRPAAALTVALKEHLDNQREFNLGFENGNSEGTTGTVQNLKHISDVCEINPRGMPAELAADNLVSFLPMADVEPHTIWLQPAQTRRMAEVAKGYTCFKTNDILVAKITPCFENGKMGIAAALVNGVGFGSTEFHVLRCSEQVSPEYLYFVLKHSSFRKTGALNMIGSAGQQRVTKEFVANFVVPIPPLDEQRAIVAEIEGYQRVVDGCRAVLASYRPSLAANPDWPRFALHQIAEIDPKRPQFDLPSNGAVSFLPMADLSVRQRSITPQKTRPLNEVIKGYTYFAERDLLVAKITPCFENGKIGVVGKLQNGVGFGSTEFYVLRANDDVLPEFLFVSLCHPQFIERGQLNMSGSAGQQRLTKGFIHNYEIAVPDLDTQRALVADLQREQATLSGVAELATQFEAKIAARLAAVWGAIPAVAPSAIPNLDAVPA